MSGIPTFSRVEIRTGGIAATRNAADALRDLADALDKVADNSASDEAAAILSHHKIKATSQALRGTA